jgi:outer membrane receptor for ferrienterochelin and colicins
LSIRQRTVRRPMLNRHDNGFDARARLVCAGALLATLTGVARGQESSTREASTPQRVEISGQASAENRRDSSAAKFVLTREEIMRFGDANLVDVLQRVPGISVTSAGGQNREIRLRGLGGGYTQILIDGQPLARGASIDALSPELVERVEVIRSASADMSTQSIAGSINIILRRVKASQPGSVTAGLARTNGQTSSSVALQAGRRDGAILYSGVGTLKSDGQRWPSTTELTVQPSGPYPFGLQQSQTEAIGRRSSLALAPRLSWQSDEAYSLVLDSLLQVERFRVNARQSWQVLSGEPLFFPLSVTDSRRDATEARLSAGWKAVLSPDERVELKLATTLLRRSSDSTVRSTDAQNQRALARAVNASVEDASVTFSGSYATTLLSQHSIKFGWDGQFARRSEDRTQLESSPTGLPTLDLDENYRATVGRLALFVQDDWTPAPELQVYFGLRWEGLQTGTRGNALAAVSNQSSTVSPILQLLWQVPGSKADQVRFNLSRTYKAPTARELVPRRWIETDNSATSPDFQGNPGLQPELAWGLDLAFEHYRADQGLLALNGYFRSIDGVVLDRLFKDGDTWIVTPVNSGKATVAGVEAEVKGRLRPLGSAALVPSYRLGFARHWSRVASLPGPNNRLQRQPLYKATVGFDLESPDKAFGAGGSLSFERRGTVQTSLTQTIASNDRGALDLYGFRRLQGAWTVRLTLTNLFAKDEETRSSYLDSRLIQNQWVTSPASRGVRLALEGPLR